MKSESISVIVPFSYSVQQPEREALLHHVVNDCLTPQTYEQKRIILVESGTERTQEKFADNTGLEYMFIQKPDGGFSLGQMQDMAIAITNPGELFYLHLPDYLLPKDAIERAYFLMKQTNAPCIFPHYGAVYLTKPITEGITEKKIDWPPFLEAISDVTESEGFRDYENLIPVDGNSNRVQLTERQTEHLDTVLPDGYKSHELIGLSTLGLWGGDTKKLFSFYPWMESSGNDEALGIFRSGPRAKSSYLCRTDAFIEVGGTSVNRTGWNVEDLWFWERIRTRFMGYTIDKHGIYFDGFKLSGRYPITHLWHSTNFNNKYYSDAKAAIDEFHVFEALSREQKMARIHSLDVELLRNEVQNG